MRLILLLLFASVTCISAQNTYEITGRVTSEGQPLPFANIYIEDNSKGTLSDDNGNFIIKDLKAGTYILVASFTGIKTETKRVSITTDNVYVTFDLINKNDLDEVVITGTRTEKRRTDSPVIVNLINSETLEQFFM